MERWSYSPGQRFSIGRALAQRLSGGYDVVGLDFALLDAAASDREVIRLDLSSDKSVRAALKRIHAACGPRIASMIHLAGYCDLTGDFGSPVRSCHRWRHRTPSRCAQQMQCRAGAFLTGGSHLSMDACRERVYRAPCFWPPRSRQFRRRTPAISLGAWLFTFAVTAMAEVVRALAFSTSLSAFGSQRCRSLSPEDRWRPTF
jgi:NAD(P)-dependent dehydrogenase (short-subunit alcohol dehydrogenase family)